MNPLNIPQVFLRQSWTFFKRWQSGFVSIEPLYNSCLPKSSTVLRAIELFELAKRSEAAIVELGSSAGNGTVVLAEGSARGSGYPVYAVDDHRYTETGKGYKYLDTRKLFELNTARTQRWSPFVGSIIKPIFKKSGQALKTWSEPIGLLVIDTGDYPTDFEEWYEFVVLNGFVVCWDRLDAEGLRFLRNVDGFNIYQRVEKEHDYSLAP